MKHNSILLCILVSIAANTFTIAKAQAVDVTDSLALVDLYHSTNGPKWIHHNNWLSSKPVSTWYGIGITGSRVDYVDLSYNNLKGTLHASMGNLTSVFYLKLEHNYLSGAIPSTLGKLTPLNYLVLDYNYLSGTIPATFGKLTNLISLTLNNNYLSGTIPASLGKLTNLTYLYLYNNQLSGAIPASLGNLTKLYDLLLYNNQLSGTVPASLMKIKKLHYINISFNQLSAFEYADSATNTNPKLYGYLENNLFTFDGLQVIARNFHLRVYYAPQLTILPIHQLGNTLSVYAGGTLSNNTYHWFKAGSIDSTIISGDSTFTPSASGKYYAMVTNAIAKKLTLHSDTVSYTAPLQNNTTFLAGNITQINSADNKLLVYPNPAKDIIHIQVNGIATITLTNSAGKIIFSKSINTDSEISVSSFANGIYYLQNKNTGETQKVIVVH